LMMAGPDPICVWVEWWLWNNIDSGQICYSRSSWHWWQWNWARFQAASRLSPVFVLLSILWIDAITLKLIISRFHNVLTQNCWWNNTGLQEAKQKLGRCHLVKEASNTTQPLELLLWCFQFVLWLLTGGKYSTTIGNSFCTLSIGFFLVILVYDHTYWAYSCCRPKKKKPLLQGLQIVHARLAGESSKASIETWRSVGSDWFCPACNLSFSSLDHLS
jgi:hypothetical protein